MERLLHENVNYMWLSKLSRPDFRTINRFHSERLCDGRLEELFCQTVVMMNEEGLVPLKAAESILAEENGEYSAEETCVEGLAERTERILRKMDEQGISDKRLRRKVDKVKEESLQKLESYKQHLETH